MKNRLDQEKLRKDERVLDMLVGAALMRFGFGAIMTVFYFSHLAHLRYFWGPEGQLTWNNYMAGNPPFYSLFKYSNSTGFVCILYVSFLVISIVFMTGNCPRVVGILFTLSVFSTFDREPYLRDGGVFILTELSIYLWFAKTSACFTFPRFKVSGIGIAGRHDVAAIFHKTAMFTISCQLGIVYFWASFYKIASPSWRNGSALTLILESTRYTLPFIEHFLAKQTVFLAALGYATVLFQLSFPFLMWNSRCKPYLVFGMIILHLGIMIVTGLVMFSAIMIVADLGILSDSTWVYLRNTCSSALSNVPIRCNALMKGKNISRSRCPSRSIERRKIAESLKRNNMRQFTLTTCNSVYSLIDAHRKRFSKFRLVLVYLKQLDAIRRP